MLPAEWATLLLNVTLPLARLLLAGRQTLMLATLIVAVVPKRLMVGRMLKEQLCYLKLKPRATNRLLRVHLCITLDRYRRKVCIRL